MSLPRLHYDVSIARAHEHLALVHFEAHWPDPAPKDVVVRYPRWTPGSYLMREYARDVQQLEVRDASGALLVPERTAVDRWRVPLGGSQSLAARYLVYCHERSVRGSHLDLSHFHFNGASLFAWLEGLDTAPATLAVHLPHTWGISCALPRLPGHAHDPPGTVRLGPADHHALLDSPAEAGAHPVFPFTVANVPYGIAIAGTHRGDPSVLLADLQRIVEDCTSLFGGPVYDRYLFLLTLAEKGFGGLEHKLSSDNLAPRTSMTERGPYVRLLSLLAHEFLHTWNVKRLLPKPFLHYDYGIEQITPSLWLAEGLTDYLCRRCLLRTGLSSPKEYVTKLGEGIRDYEQGAAHTIQSLADSSRETWVKFYRSDETTADSRVSYYRQGELTWALLDLQLRAASGGAATVDSFIGALWHRCGVSGRGYTEQDVIDQLATLLPTFDATAFHAAYVEGTTPLPLQEALASVGLTLLRKGKEDADDDKEPTATAQSRSHDPLGGWMGVVPGVSGNRLILKEVRRGGPAAAAGLSPDDELIALDGERVSDTDQLTSLLKALAPKTPINVLFSREGIVSSTTLTLGRPPAKSITIIADPQATEGQAALGDAWLCGGRGRLPKA